VRWATRAACCSIDLTGWYELSASSLSRRLLLHPLSRSSGVGHRALRKKAVSAELRAQLPGSRGPNNAMSHTPTRQEGSAAKKPHYLLAPQFALQNDLPRGLDTMDLQNTLADVEPDSTNSPLLDGLLEIWQPLATAFGTLVPGAEAIHPIKLNSVDAQTYRRRFRPFHRRSSHQSPRRASPVEVGCHSSDPKGRVTPLTAHTDERHEGPGKHGEIGS
jgi:hypothetical protein